MERLKNGDLLRAAATSNFDVLLTGDQGIPFQQNVATSDVFIVVLMAQSNALEDLLPLVPQILQAIGEPQRGQVVRIS